MALIGKHLLNSILLPVTIRVVEEFFAKNFPPAVEMLPFLLYIYGSCLKYSVLLVMYFSLIDKIESLEPGKRIVATKSLSLAEEYLRDHFPNFPVMPGVLMLESLTQATAWLIRVSENFAHSVVVLKEVRNVKYARFVQPGQTLIIESEIVQETENLVTLRAEGSVEGQNNLKAKLVLCRYNLSDTDPSQTLIDNKLTAEMRQRLKNLYRPMM